MPLWGLLPERCVKMQLIKLMVVMGLWWRSGRCGERRSHNSHRIKKKKKKRKQLTESAGRNRTQGEEGVH